MNIAYIANSRFPSERAHMAQIVHMCNAFSAIGHEVTLYVTNRQTEVKEQPEQYYGVPINFTIKRVTVPDIAGNITVVPTCLRKYVFSIQRMCFLIGVSSLLRRERPTIVYGRDEWILWLLSVSIRATIVWESHEARFSFAARRLTARKVPCVVISEGIRDFYMAQGIDESKIVVAHDAVDERFFEVPISTSSARSNLGVSPDSPVVMYIGGLEDWKGVKVLLESSKISSSYSIYIIGGKAEEIARYRAVYPAVHFLGQRPYRDLVEHQQAADVLVITNTKKDITSAQYTSPLKLFAYMTSGKPIVAPSLPSICNILTDNEAFIYSADDPDSLHEAINAALTDKAEARRRAENAYNLSKQYTWTERATLITSRLMSIEGRLSNKAEEKSR